MSHPNPIPVGIDCIGFYTSRYCVDLAAIAPHRNRRPAVYERTVGQRTMAVPPPDEDVVTMGANAAAEAIQQPDAHPEQIELLLFATESAVDQAKAGAITIHRLLGLPERCRALELKQACYSATAAVRLAIPYLRARPDARVLVVASDIARYGLNTPGESTQGAGAIALLLAAQPRIAAFDDDAGFYTEDVDDFWRPNYRDEALVDGRLSVHAYLHALAATWEQYHAASARHLGDLHRFCYHLPFTRMAETAHRHLLRHHGEAAEETTVRRHLNDSLHYNRVIGNSYTASLYIALLCLLEHDHQLAGRRIALFSYGSGCMAEFFSATIADQYRARVRPDRHQATLDTRTQLSYDDYVDFYRFQLPRDGSSLVLPRHDTGRFRLAAVEDHRRRYDPVPADPPGHGPNR